MSDEASTQPPLTPVSYALYDTDFDTFAEQLGASFARYGFAVVTDHGLDQGVIDDLIHKAHQVCPYSNATRGNVDVALSAG